jgi:hypothetical protein
MFYNLLIVFIVDLWNVKENYNYNYHGLSLYCMLVTANAITSPEGQKS